MTAPLTVRVVTLGGQPVPERASAGAAGFDLRAAEDVTLAPGERRLVPTGIRLEIPPGWEAQVRPRSGLAWKQGLTVLNGPGTIDSDFRGEVGVILIHLGASVVTLKAGDRIAQLVFAAVPEVDWRVVDELENSDRGRGGFGSTG
ncbi:MAG: dUTP diphosphatase [Acidobacteriota bacterium]